MHRQRDVFLRGSDRPEELVLDPAASAGRGWRAAASRFSFAPSEDRAPLETGDAEDVLRHDVVARAQDADEDRRHDERRREDRVRREVVAGADAERERQDGDEDERRDDRAEPAAVLALGVEAVAPEDEHGDEREERQPLRLGVAPDQSPQHRPRARHDLAQRERGIDAERQPAEVQQEQRRRCSQGGARTPSAVRRKGCRGGAPGRPRAVAPGSSRGVSLPGSQFYVRPGRSAALRPGRKGKLARVKVLVTGRSTGDPWSPVSPFLHAP